MHHRTHDERGNPFSHGPFTGLEAGCGRGPDRGFFGRLFGAHGRGGFFPQGRHGFPFGRGRCGHPDHHHGEGHDHPFEDEHDEHSMNPFMMRGRGDFPFGPGRGRMGRRPFEQGDLKWLVLDLIAAQPRHGYEIIKAIEESLDGHYSPSPGVIYPTLTLLEETGLITGETQGVKKLYTITDAGRSELAAHAADVEAVRSRVSGARASFGGVPAPEMIRAMGNLHNALQVRLSRGALSREAVNAISAAIDRAAAEIERS